MARGSGQLADPVQGLSQHGALLLQDAAMVAEDLGQRVRVGSVGDRADAFHWNAQLTQGQDPEQPGTLLRPVAAVPAFTPRGRCQ